MLKGFCQKRYHSYLLSQQRVEELVYPGNQNCGPVIGNTPSSSCAVALDSVSAILSKLVSQAETRFLGTIRSLGDANAGALNAAQLLKVQMDVTLNNTTTSMSSSILAAIGSMLRSISNNIHA